MSFQKAGDTEFNWGGLEGTLTDDIQQLLNDFTTYAAAELERRNYNIKCIDEGVIESIKRRRIETEYQIKQLIKMGEQQ